MVKIPYVDPVYTGMYSGKKRQGQVRDELNRRIEKRKDNKISYEKW
jgi:hypothetical protein